MGAQETKSKNEIQKKSFKVSQNVTKVILCPPYRLIDSYYSTYILKVNSCEVRDMGITFTASRFRKTKVNLMLIYLLPIIGDCNPHKYAHINSIYVVAVVERCYVIYTRQDIETSFGFLFKMSSASANCSVGSIT